jgi:methionyl aminopeptidase
VALRLKSAEDIAGIYRSGQIAGAMLNEIAQLIRPGVTTAELDRFGAEFIAGHGGVPAFLHYNGYPANLCISVNEEVVHGIPSVLSLQEGDLVSVDVGVVLNGYFSDTARTYLVGPEPAGSDLQRLMSGTRDSLFAGIAQVTAGAPLRLVSRAIEDVLRRHRLGVIHELTGHGTGFALHEEPTVYNFDPRTRHPLIHNGLVLAIEPMASLGSPEVLLGSDNWCYRTADGSLAAHYEHTIACWDGQAYLLTAPGDEAARQAFGGR